MLKDGSLTPLQSPSSVNSQQQSRSPYPSPVLKVTRVVSPASASASPQYTRSQPTPGPTDLFSPPISTTPAVQQQRNVHFTATTSPRSREDVFSSPQANQEMTRHLRELLQRQQFKKETPADQRIWNSEDVSNQEIGSPNIIQSQDFETSAGPTFRQPLPPSAVKTQRMPFQPMGASNAQMVIRHRAQDPKLQVKYLYII